MREGARAPSYCTTFYTRDRLHPKKSSRDSASSRLPRKSRFSEVAGLAKTLSILPANRKSWALSRTHWRTRSAPLHWVRVGTETTAAMSENHFLTLSLSTVPVVSLRRRAPVSFPRRAMLLIWVTWISPWRIGASQHMVCDRRSRAALHFSCPRRGTLMRGSAWPRHLLRRLVITIRSVLTASPPGGLELGWMPLHDPCLDCP